MIAIADFSPDGKKISSTRNTENVDDVLSAN